MTTIISQEYDPSIPIGSLKEHPQNPRRGDDSSVSESIEHNGFFGAILVQRSTGHILAGNTRYRAMRARGEESVPGFWIDCDDLQAKKIMLVDNRSSDLAYYDDAELSKLLLSVHHDDSLTGTGYSQASIDLLIDSANTKGDLLGGVRQGLTPIDRAASYEASDIRSIILPYDHSDYEFVVDGFSRLRKELELQTNAEVVVKLLQERLT